MISRSKGQSLVSVLVGVAIAGILMLAMISAIITQQKETRALSDKLAALQLEKLLISALAGGSICQAELAGRSINLSNLGANSIALPSIRSNVAGTPPHLITQGDPLSPDSSLRIAGIRVANFAGTGTRFTANFEISLNGGV